MKILKNTYEFHPINWLSSCIEQATVMWYIVRCALYFSHLRHLPAIPTARGGEAGAYELTINPWASGLFCFTWHAYIPWYRCVKQCGKILQVCRDWTALKSCFDICNTSKEVISLQCFGFCAENGSQGSIWNHPYTAMDLGDSGHTSGLPMYRSHLFTQFFLDLGLHAYTFGQQSICRYPARVHQRNYHGMSAFGLAFDAGVQYVNGPEDNFKFGIVYAILARLLCSSAAKVFVSILLTLRYIPIQILHSISVQQALNCLPCQILVHHMTSTW